MSEKHPNRPLMVGGDLVEAVFLRLDDDTYRRIDGGVELDSEGNPITGDPVVDQWEREARENGVKRS